MLCGRSLLPAAGHHLGCEQDVRTSAASQSLSQGLGRGQSADCAAIASDEDDKKGNIRCMSAGALLKISRLEDDSDGDRDYPDRRCRVR
jgi:hypothetical protein